MKLTKRFGIFTASGEIINAVGAAAYGLGQTARIFTSLVEAIDADTTAEGIKTRISQSWKASGEFFEAIDILGEKTKAWNQAERAKLPSYRIRVMVQALIDEVNAWNDLQEDVDTQELPEELKMTLKSIIKHFLDELLKEAQKKNAELTK